MLQEHFSIQFQKITMEKANKLISHCQYGYAIHFLWRQLLAFGIILCESDQIKGALYHKIPWTYDWHFLPMTNNRRNKQ